MLKQLFRIPDAKVLKKRFLEKKKDRVVRFLSDALRTRGDGAGGFCAYEHGSVPTLIHTIFAFRLSELIEHLPEVANAGS